MHALNRYSRSLYSNGQVIEPNLQIFACLVNTSAPGPFPARRIEGWKIRNHPRRFQCCSLCLMVTFPQTEPAEFVDRPSQRCQAVSDFPGHSSWENRDRTRLKRNLRNLEVRTVDRGKQRETFLVDSVRVSASLGPFSARFERPWTNTTVSCFFLLGDESFCYAYRVLLKSYATRL